MQISPKWSGEDVQWYGFKSATDVIQFPNLKEMVLFGTDKKIIKQFEQKGIIISEL
jgi:hypothetical protein